MKYLRWVERNPWLTFLLLFGTAEIIRAFGSWFHR